MAEWKGVDGFKPEGPQRGAREVNVLTPSDPEYVNAKADLDEWREPDKLPDRKPLKKSDRALWECSQCGCDNTRHVHGVCPTAEDVPLPEFRSDLLQEDPRERL